MVFLFFSLGWERKVGEGEGEGLLKGEGKLILSMRGCVRVRWVRYGGPGLFICTILFLFFKRRMKSVQLCSAIQCIDVPFYANPHLHSSKLS